jgi:hypothetical protein
MKIKLHINLYLLTIALISLHWNVLMAQSDEQKEKQKIKQQMENERLKDNPYVAEIYFPLLLLNSYDETGDSFQNAIDRFFDTRAERQGYLRSAEATEKFEVKVDDSNPNLPTVFFPILNILPRLQKDSLTLKAMLDNYVFLGRDAFIKEEKEKDEIKPYYMGAQQSKAALAADAKKVSSDKDENKTVRNNRKSPIIAMQLQNNNYAVWDESLGIPIFADQSLYAYTAGDYQLNLSRFILSFFAFMAAYPDYAEKIPEKFKHMLFNAQWRELYSFMIDYTPADRKGITDKLLRINQLQIQ